MAELLNAAQETASTKPSSVVFAKTLVAGIDLQNALLAREHVELLQLLSARHQDCIRHGRGREVQAMASAMLIVWRKLCELDIALELSNRLRGGGREG